MKVIKKDLIDKLATTMKMKKSLSTNIIECLFEIIFNDLSIGNKVLLPGIGTLSPVLHKPRRTGTMIEGQYRTIPSSLRVRIISSEAMKQKMKLLHASQLMEEMSLFK